MTDADAIDHARAHCAASSTSRLIERNGEAVIEVTTSTAAAAIALQGAQVLSWRPSQTQRDVLWCPPHAIVGGGKAIRGGVPICWPWFGPSDKGQHGFARNRHWRLTSIDTCGVDTILALTIDGGADAAFGPAVSARLNLRVGPALSLHLSTSNASSRDVPITAAFHPYFSVSDVRRILVDGLDGASAVDLDKAGATHMQSGSIRFDTGRTLRFDAAPQSATIVDPGFARRIDVHRFAGRSSIVWHPGAAVAALADVPSDMAYGFVCLESGAVGASRVVLKPGERHDIEVEYRVTTAT